MSTLLLRFAAPLQAWGSESKFNIRSTQREPTKSAVIGLLAAALGILREDAQALEPLHQLRFGVRIDQPGQLLHDFHTAHKPGDANPFVTHRYYLADAVFLVALEGADDALEPYAHALRHPVFPLFFGRRSCPPEGRLVLDISKQPLERALQETPWQASEFYQKRDRKKHDEALTIVRDAAASEPGAFLRRDLPLSFSQRQRQYAFRNVRDLPGVVEVNAQAAVGTQHDAFGEV
jgi:CRISPR system Cascade subunit CasD